MQSIFKGGYKGLSDTLFSGPRGSVYRSVGIDHRSTPGLIKVQQKLVKDSGEVVDELCKASVDCSDGSKLWFSSESGKIWREVSGTYTLVYTLSLAEYDIFTLSDSGNVGDISTDVSQPIVFLGPNDGSVTTRGKKMISFDYFDDIAYGYDLTDNWDVSTPTFDNSFDHSAQTTGGAAGGFVRPDGDKMFIADQSKIFRYSISNFDLSGASYDTNTLDFSAQTTACDGIWMKDDGLKLYIKGEEVIYQYTLSTAWDLSSASYDTVSFSIASETGFATGFAISPDGEKMIVCSNNSSTVRGLLQYTLSTPWDLSTASYDNKTFRFNSDSIPTSISFKTDDDEDHVYFGITNQGTVKDYNIAFSDPGEVKTLDAKEWFYYEATNGSISSTVTEEWVYWAVQNYMLRVPVSKLGDFAEFTQPVGVFENGNTEHHPMTIQNLKLFIGDDYVVSEVDVNGTFTQNTELNLPEEETIQTLISFDVDVLIGTKYRNKGRTLRWDTSSASWSAEDDVFEKEGVTAFIRDDNYVYVVAGHKGGLYFYNGEQNKLMTRVPEVEGGKVKVNHNAVGFLNYIPVIGLSNQSGNSVLQGVYGFGKYSRDYPTTLTLDFPVPSDEFSSVEIGSILVDGEDLYLSWKDGTDVGVAKIDNSNKYESAYFETMALISPETRHQLKTLTDVLVPYHSKPASTNVTIGVKKNYGASFEDKTVVDDAKRMQIKLKTPSTKDVANPQLRIGFTVNDNDAVEIEDTLWDIANISNK